MVFALGPGAMFGNSDLGKAGAPASGVQNCGCLRAGGVYTPVAQAAKMIILAEKGRIAMNPPSLKLVTAIVVLLLCASTAIGQKELDPLKSGFENPPEGARPRVWWHWMNG